MSNFLRRRRRAETAKLGPRWDTLADAMRQADERRAAQDRAGEALPEAAADAPDESQRTAGAVR